MKQFPTLTRLHKLYRTVLLPAFALVLLGLMWGAVAYQVRQEHRTARYEATLRSQSLAQALAEHANHLLRQTDHATQLFKLKYEESRGALRLSGFERSSSGLFKSLMIDQLDLPMALLDARGRVIDSRSGYFPDSLADQAFFRVHAGNAEDRSVVSTPVADTRTKKWHVQISRRLNDQAGHFAGVVVLMVDPAELVRDYDRLTLDRGGAAMLISSENGMATARVDDQLVISDGHELHIEPVGSGHAAGEVSFVQPFDHVARIYGYKDMPRYHLVAVAGNPVASALVRFSHRRMLYYGAVAVASVLVLAVVGLLMHKARRLAESTQQVIDAQLMLRAAADSSLDAVYMFTARRAADGEIVDFIIAYLNERAAARFGYTSEDAKGRTLREVAPHLHAQGYIDKYIEVMRTGQPIEAEVESALLQGERWLQFQIVAIRDGVAVTTRNITPRKEQELAMRRKQEELAGAVTALRESEARLRTITDALPAMIAYIDNRLVYRFQNIAYEHEFNRNGAMVLGRTLRDAVGEPRYAQLEPYVRRVLAGEMLSFEEEDGNGCTFEVFYIPQMDADAATVIGFHVMRQNITLQKREKQRLLRMSQVDGLTGLANRSGFLQKLLDSMAANRESGALMAVMYMDIDRFKPVNDTHGHSMGDALLKIFSARLTHALRATDTVARMGGDEFTVILEHLAREEDAGALALKIVGAMAAPFDLGGVVVSVSASIGMAYYRNEDLGPAELLNRADVLLYEAKQAGRNTYRAGPALPAPSSNAA